MSSRVITQKGRNPTPGGPYNLGAAGESSGAAAAADALGKRGGIILQACSTPWLERKRSPPSPPPRVFSKFSCAAKKKDYKHFTLSTFKPRGCLLSSELVRASHYTSGLTAYSRSPIRTARCLTSTSLRASSKTLRTQKSPVDSR